MAKTKADLVEELSVGKSDDEIAELEKMTKAELEELAEAGGSESAATGLDETVEGGRYKVGGQIVNADGEKIK